MNNYHKFFLLFFLTALSVFVLPGIINAQEGGGGEIVCPPPPSCPVGNVWDEYQCTATCKADIQTRRVWEWYTLETAPSSGDCPAYFCQYHIYRDPWKTIQSCQPWQGCEPQGVIKNKAPTCSCAGECLETPQNPKYYDNPDYLDKPDKSMPSANVKLPTKFDWDDVEGWLKSPDGPKSYIFKFQDAITKILNKSEYAGLREEKGACFLKSNSNYSWQAQACCSAEGENCGNNSNWNFTVSPAPEIISPEDPDWTGPKGAGNIVITPTSPMKIDWCDVEGANSYRLRVLLLDEKTNQKICSPILDNPFATGDRCESWLIDKERRDPYQLEKLLYSDFTDEDLDFFTKDTTYDWEVKMCLDDYGGIEAECKDYSQRWSFTSSQQTFKGVNLVYPPDDQKGETPVGFPIILEWSAPSGMNSFWYQIYSVTDSAVIKTSWTTVSQSKSLNSSDLPINRLYKWKVKACSDFFALECEEYSQERYFKTTGRPPVLKEPAAGVGSAPIPVNLKWEDVPGAKTYFLKVQGGNLNLEKTVEKPEFSLGYPEYNISQDTNYSWQVKTCAYEGYACGSFSPAQTFKTFRLPAPSTPSPENNGQLFTDEKFVSWASVQGANAYQYQVRYASLSENEKDETCPAAVGKDIFAEPKTIQVNSDFTELRCLGNYQWQARACLDADCKQTGDWGNWTFSLVEPEELKGLGGLIPCGQPHNNPATSWNEREPCEMKHAFLLIKVILDFFSIRIVPIILVILTIYSGLMFYFSINKAPVLAKIISLWKSVGIGVAIIAFAWTAVNIFLRLIGIIVK